MTLNEDPEVRDEEKMMTVPPTKGDRNGGGNDDNALGDDRQDVLVGGAEVDGDIRG